MPITELREDPCRQLVVAVHQSDVLDCVDNNTIQDVFRTCPAIQVKLAYHWLRLLLSEYYNRHRLGSTCTSHDPSSSFLLKLYTYDNRSLLFEDLTSGRADIYPFEIVINERTIRQYYIASPLSITKYHFYINDMIDPQSYAHSSPLTFLTSPFTGSVWICMALAAMCGFILCSATRSVRKKFLPWQNILTSERLIYALIFAPLATLSTPYCSLLKALVAQPSLAQPFDSLFDLSNLIKSGQTKIMIESRYSLRLRMLTRKDFFRSPGLESVYEALSSKRGSFLIADNMSQVCTMLETRPKEYIYFGYDAIVYTTCTKMCFWKYELNEDIDQLVAFVVGKKATVLTRMADVFSHAIPNYRESEMNRKYKAACPKRTSSNAMFIDPASLKTAFMFLGGGWGASILLTMFDLARYHYLKKKQYKVREEIRENSGADTDDTFETIDL